MRFLSAVSIIGLLVSLPVSAQEHFGVPKRPIKKSEANTADWSSIPVKDRQYKHFTPKGLNLDGLVYHQDITIEAGHAQNVYLDNTNEKDDQFLSVKPELALKSDWELHHLLLTAEAEVKKFKEYHSENKTDFSLRSETEIDITRHLKGFAGLRYSQAHTDRRQIRSAISPDSLYRQDKIAGEVGLAMEAGAWHSSLAIEYEDVQFKDARNRANLTQKAVRSDSDRTSLGVVAEIGREITRHLNGYVQLAYKTLNFDKLTFNNALQNFSGDNRDSNQIGIGAGVTGYLTKNISGRVFTGIEKKSFDQTGVDDATNHVIDMAVSWNPSALSTLRGEYNRRLITDNDIEGESVQNSYVLGYDHEVLRSLVVSAQGEFVETEFDTAGREDEDHLLMLDARYQLNETFEFNFGGVYHDRQSTNALNEFDDMTIMFRLKHRL